MTCFFCGQAASQRWMSEYNIHGGVCKKGGGELSYNSPSIYDFRWG